MTEEKAPANRIEPRTHYQDPKDATIWGKLYRVHGRTRHAVAIRVFRPILAGTLTSGRRPLATTSSRRPLPLARRGTSMPVSVQRPEPGVPLNWNFPAMIGPENRKQVG